MKVVGYRESSFKGDQGEMIYGVNLYLTYPLEKGKGEGEGTERVFVTKTRLSECEYEPAVGDEVKLEYNRFGKVSGLSVVN